MRVKPQHLIKKGDFKQWNWWPDHTSITLSILFSVDDDSHCSQYHVCTTYCARSCQERDSGCSDWQLGRQLHSNCLKGERDKGTTPCSKAVKSPGPVERLLGRNRPLLRGHSQLALTSQEEVCTHFSVTPSSRIFRLRPTRSQRPGGLKPVTHQGYLLVRTGMAKSGHGWARAFIHFSTMTTLWGGYHDYPNLQMRQPRPWEGDSTIYLLGKSIL